VIVEIEGQAVAEGFLESTADAVKLLKGKPGVKVTISVQHVGQSDEIVTSWKSAGDHPAGRPFWGTTYNPTRPGTSWLDEAAEDRLHPPVALSAARGEELTAALQTLKAGGMQGLVLDLRFNPGGLLSQATEVADLFVESGKIVSTEGRNSPERVWNAKQFGNLHRLPHGRAGQPLQRVGQRDSERLPAGPQAGDRDRRADVGQGERAERHRPGRRVDSALKLTTASYHRPSGKNIHRFPGAKEADEWGVLPDEKYGVRFTNEQLRDYLEYRRKRDVLVKEGPPKSEFKDDQLAKALEYLNEKVGGAAAAQESNNAGDKTSQTDSAASDEQAAAAKRLENFKRALIRAKEGLGIYVGSAT
jgi:carboxyl-terminal processing protease